MKQKLLILITVVLLLATLMTGGLSLGLVRTGYINELEDKLLSNAQLIDGFITQLDIETSSIQQIIDDTEHKIDSRITIVDTNGEVIADSEFNKGEMENHIDRPEIKGALKGHIGRSERYSATIQEDMLYIAIPSGREDVGAIRLSVTLTEIGKIHQKLLTYIGLAILLSLTMAFILSYRFLNKFIDPVKEMTDISKKMAEGELDRKVRIYTNDEIGMLGKNFNNMGDRLKNTFDRLSDSNTKFQALLTSIINPIIAVDNQKRVIIFNHAAEQLFNTTEEEAVGKHILEIIRNHFLDKEIQTIFNEKIETQIEIKLKHPETKVLKIYTNLIKLENDPTKVIGMVALIEDMTEVRRLEKIRSDFAINVSHELKTPLTSIKGFIETLKMGAIEDEQARNRFLDIIDIETDRLSRLIEDILTLSKIENYEKKIQNKAATNVENAIKEAQLVVEPLADRKEITIKVEIEKDLPEVYGNSDWFKQMMINLIDNGVKYTSEGGEISINAYKKHQYIIISVRDTGIGIPKENLSRIFERFYRVDKGRSRKVGGTGLGLAIVKHVVLSFNGKVKVNSVVGKGTEFVVQIPYE
ncbi:ATP-binding protein [Serpentinicella sp. ANB-PHB4]|uniref:two-component system histidine kinase PnpS n=1 Tax=Serpentinicella sp. ANB-PHB4 TaxID=3074076 RepID=UPI002856ACD0|nr:ATP-binding protein [Serpentinicella sp. ANB-PHB4]MDR5658833.1 ATP-binding protein [Serpentinicella sp. ANB-PHB4]